MKIHTNKPKLVEEHLAKLNLKYKYMSKKFNKHIGINWDNLPGFNWDKALTDVISYNVPLLEEQREGFFKEFGVKNTKLNYINWKKTPSIYKKIEYKITHIINPKYPVYVLSKGRWNKRYTIDALKKMNCPYTLVIEPKEYDNYVKNVKKENIKVLPEKYLNKNQGGIPARNFIWQDAMDRGFDKHWIIDDNIKSFLRWNYNVQKKIDSGVVFKIIEDYTDRYTNIGLSGLSYFFSVPQTQVQRKILTVNSRCYSCILINHTLLNKTLKERWRGKYNEDTDLSLRVLKANLSTLLFNNYLADKITSGQMKGGNTDTLYKGGTHEGYMDKFNALKAQHPLIVKFTNKKHKDRRPHHHINYRKFNKHLPKIKEGLIIPKVDNEYNMVMIGIKETKIYYLTDLLQKLKI